MSAPGSGRANGFTLFELLVVLAILGLVGGLGYPALARAVRGGRVRGAAATAVATLREARARAVATGTPVRVRAGADNVLRADGAAPLALPAGMAAGVSPTDGIRFFGDGTSNGGALMLGAEGWRARLVVSPATGLVRAGP